MKKMKLNVQPQHSHKHSDGLEISIKLIVGYILILMVYIQYQSLGEVLD